MKCDRILSTLWPACRMLTLASVGVLALAAQPAEAQQTRNIVPADALQGYWAIVVGVDEPNATYRTHDAELVAATLGRCGYHPDNILLMTRRAPEPGLNPLQENLHQQMEGFLGRVGPQDRLVVYLAGNAYRDEAGQVYLASADYWENADPAAGLAAAWLRERLEACPAELKLLVLDISRAGPAGGSVTGVSGVQVGTALEGVEGLGILTSCRADEEPLMWEAAEQSLFGFWFSKAIAGHAGCNGQHRVSVRDLYECLFANVSRTAGEVFGRNQTPDRLGDLRPCPRLAIGRAEPMSRREALDAMAAQLVAMTVKNNVSRLSVAEFRPLDGLSGPGPGSLGRLCAKELEPRLMQEASLAGVSFELVPHDSLHAALTRGGFTPAGFHTGATRGIRVHGQEVGAVAVGSFCVLTDRMLTLRCDLRETETQRLIGRTQATALLNEEEWFQLTGFGGAAPTDDLPPPTAPSPEHPVAPSDDPQRLRPGRPEDFRVTVHVDGRPRESVYVEREEMEYVPLSRGEVYRILVENRSDQRVYLRLLVDGLNTLPEAATGPSGSAGRPVVYLPAQRVALDRARAWRLAPRPPDAESKRYTIRGFYHRLGAGRQEGKGDWEWETFKVVDAAESLAHQQGYTEQTGLITAAFYGLPRLRSRGLGTCAGETERGELTEYRETPVGDLLGVVNIRYVEPEALERLTQEQGIDEEDDATETDATTGVPSGFRGRGWSSGTETQRCKSASARSHGNAVNTAG